RHRLDRAEDVLACRSSGEPPKALEIFVLLVLVSRPRVQIRAAVVTLPDLYRRILDRLAAGIQDLAAQVSDLAYGWRQRVIDDDQVVVRIQWQLVRIKRPLGLRRRPHQLFCKRPRGQPQRRSRSRRSKKSTPRANRAIHRPHDRSPYSNTPASPRSH